jgi:UDP-N-acetylmuramoylalanine--D-glutamate ligase
VLKGKRITVLGGGLSGRAAATLARNKGAQVVLSDLRADCPTLDGVENCMGEHPDGILETDILVVSPGVPAKVPAISRARAFGAEVTSELGFAARFLDPETPIVAITGTNGKSTVTAFMGQLFEAADWKVFAGGNLGTPLSEAVGRDWDVLVVEVSSYQLELPGAFSPSIAAVLNLSPDHLARHGSMASYAEHKLRLLQITRPDGDVLLPAENVHLDQAASVLKRPIRRFDSPSGFVLRGKSSQMGEETLDLSTLQVPGALNRWNAAAACLLARLSGLPRTSLRPDLLRPLPHRMQVLPVHSRITWINDSKATNVEATRAGVSGLEGEVFLLLGGLGKEGADYRVLRSLFEGPVVQAVVYGQAAPQIAEALDGLPYSVTQNLAQAVAVAGLEASDGNIVVLSPACASFDEFDDFTHRGKVFQSLVNAGLEGVALGRNP